MKRLLFLILLVIFLFSGCDSFKTESSPAAITINMPADGSVNGYRVSSRITESDDGKMPDYIKAEDVGVIDNDPTNTINNNYCGNKNSKVFHRSDCSSLAKTKEENKVYFNTRNDFITSGYKPCSRCNP